MRPNSKPWCAGTQAVPALNTLLLACHQTILSRCPYTCAESADALVLVAEWEEFRAVGFERLKTTMARPIAVDLRNIYRPEEMVTRRFLYSGIGRAPGLEPNISLKMNLDGGSDASPNS